MLEGARIAVVVPAFDEARWIGETVATMPAFVDRTIVVDDASTDATGNLARAAGAEVVRHAVNKGVGAAIATGYAIARAARYDAVAVMAGDGQMDPADLARVLQPVVRGDADYVKGDRLAHPDAMRKMPAARLAGTWLLAHATRLATGLDDLHDSQCGFTAIGLDTLDTLDLDALWPGYGYPNDLLATLARARRRVAEVVVRPVYRGEASGLRARHVGVIAFLLARATLRRAEPLRRNT